MAKQLLKEPNSVQMIDARAAKLSDYNYPITKSSNWAGVIGYPQVGAPRSNHERVFCRSVIEMHENRNPFKCNCPTTARINDAYCPITQARRVLSNYTVLLMLKSGLSIKPIRFENFAIVLITDRI